MAPAVIQPSEAELMAAAYAAVAEPMATARAYGPLPSMYSPDWVVADVAVRRATLLVAGMTWSFIVGPARRHDLREAGLDVHAGDRTTWRLLAARPSRAQVERWRAQPQPIVGTVA